MKGVAGMRTWMGSLVFNLVLASNGFSVQELPPEVAEHGYPDLVVVNGEIVSMDDASTRPEPGKIFEALAVKKDRIVALGSNEQIKALVGPKTRFIDVKGRTVIPGLVEPHAHLYGYALERLGEEMGLQIPTRGKRISIKVKPEDSLSSVKETILSRVRQETDSLKPGDWLVANASGHPLLTPWGRTKQLPVRAALDQVAPKNPVLLTAGPRGFINSKALEEASKAMPGYTQYMNASMGPEAEELGWVGVPEMGALTWEMWLAEKPLSLLAELFRREGQAWTSYGVTTFATRIPLPRVLSGYDLLHRKG
ncbi:MAG: amidohydrolase family protein, partial [Acidobacteria bacterium]|nr:amidohydrolase family protein [Acidobacteriota bacterium]